MLIILYSGFFMIFVSVLFCFHNLLISKDKTTAEFLKREKGLVRSGLRENPYSYGSLCLNFNKTICCRRLKYRSKLTYEFVAQNDDPDGLLEFYVCKEQAMGKQFKKLHELEKTVSVYKPSKDSFSSDRIDPLLIDDIDINFRDKDELVFN